MWACGEPSPEADVGTGRSQSRRRCGHSVSPVPVQMWAVAVPNHGADVCIGEVKSRCRCGQWVSPVMVQMWQGASEVMVPGRRRSPGADAQLWQRHSLGADLGGGEPSPCKDVGSLRIAAPCGGAPSPRALGCRDGLGHRRRTRMRLRVCVRAHALACVQPTRTPGTRQGSLRNRNPDGLYFSESWGAQMSPEWRL